MQIWLISVNGVPSYSDRCVQGCLDFVRAIAPDAKDDGEDFACHWTSETVGTIELHTLTLSDSRRA